MTFNDRFTVKGRLRWWHAHIKWWAAYWIDFKAPVHVDIEPTSACNLRCTHCHQTANPRLYDLKKTALSEMKARLDEAKAAGVLAVKFVWRGEPLIHSDIWEAMRYAMHDLDFTDVMLNTNLSVNLTDEQVRILADLTTLKVSIDSVTNYPNVRVGGDLELVMSNINRILEYRRWIQTNRHEIDICEPFEEYRKAFGKYVDLTKIRMYNGVAQKRNDKDFYQSGKGRERVYCGMPSRRLLLSATTGKIYPCCAVYNEEPGMSVGEKGESWLTAWNSSRIKQLRQKLRKGEFDSDACRNCQSSDAWR